MKENNEDKNRLIARFISLGEAESAAWRHQDIKTFNRCIEDMGSVVDEIKNKCSLNDLIPLMEYSDPYVQLYAAYYCLGFEQAKAVSKIRDLAYSGNIARDTAFTILCYIGEE